MLNMTGLWVRWGGGVYVYVCVWRGGGALKTEFCFGVKCEVMFSTNTPSSTALTHSCSSAGPPPPLMKMLQSQV